MKSISIFVSNELKIPVYISTSEFEPLTADEAEADQKVVSKLEVLVPQESELCKNRGEKLIVDKMGQPQVVRDRIYSFAA